MNSLPRQLCRLMGRTLPHVRSFLSSFTQRHDHACLPRRGEGRVRRQLEKSEATSEHKAGAAVQCELPQASGHFVLAG